MEPLEEVVRREDWHQICVGIWEDNAYFGKCPNFQMTFQSIVFSGISFGNQLTTGPHTVDVCQEIHYMPYVWGFALVEYKCILWGLPAGKHPLSSCVTCQSLPFASLPLPRSLLLGTFYKWIHSGSQNSNKCISQFFKERSSKEMNVY